MAKECPTCHGARRIWRSVDRTWWHILLRHPARIDEICPTCVGRGTVAEPSDEETRQRKQREQQRSELLAEEQLKTKRLAAQYDNREAARREKNLRKHQLAQQRSAEKQRRFNTPPPSKGMLRHDIVCTDCGRTQSFYSTSDKPTLSEASKSGQFIGWRFAPCRHCGDWMRLCRSCGESADSYAEARGISGTKCRRCRASRR